MNTPENKEDFYDRFRIQLDNNHKFPCEYTFKFILPTDNKNIALLQRIFDKANATFSSKSSKNSKYTSITINALMLNSESVIEYYKETSQIDNLIMI